MQERRPPISSYNRPITLDSLKYMKDRLIGALEVPEIIDKLGDLALGLCNTAQMLEPMKYIEGEELGGSHPDPDWPDKNRIPLTGSNEFVISGRQISLMPVQKDRISDSFASESIARMCTIISVAQSGLTCVNVSSLAHETSHAHDCVTNPVLEIDPKSDQVNLRSELQAYAVSKVLQDYLTYNDRIMFSCPSVSDRVEEVRRKVNGPLQSENAFDVNDDLIEQLDRAGLRGIY